MSISLKTHKMLWGRSANRCSFPNCYKALVVDETETDDPSVIGEEAHIVAKKHDGSRGLSPLSFEKRDLFDNLILLCREHHKIVDDQSNHYTVEKLKEYKANHLKYVRDNLMVDKKKIKDDELYATYVEKFIELTDLHNWNNWTSWAIGTSEIFPKANIEELKKVPEYIVSRLWPHRHKGLEDAIDNFKNIVIDLLNVLNMHLDENRSKRDGYTTVRFYKEYYRDKCEFNGMEYSFEAEQSALNKYHYHTALLLDLLLELTRAANYICDFIRSDIFEGFRIEEGVLLITSSDFFKTTTIRVEYQANERSSRPYLGLKDFMQIRSSRDYSIGEGVDGDYFMTMPWEKR